MKKIIYNLLLYIPFFIVSSITASQDFKNNQYYDVRSIKLVLPDDVYQTCKAKSFSAYKATGDKKFARQAYLQAIASTKEYRACADLRKKMIRENELMNRLNQYVVDDSHHAIDFHSLKNDQEKIELEDDLGMDFSGPLFDK